VRKTRRGFTLIELLIVTVVIATLMGIVFRLAGVGGDNRAKAETVDRLQRLENALSGYYAAFGSYPPVPLQGRSRSIYKHVDSCGVQETGSGETGEKGSLNWSSMSAQVLAACKAQPVAVLYPFNERRDGKMVDELSSMRVGNGSSKNSFSVIRNVGGLNLTSTDWRECSVFQFGLLSFLLPRYAFMLDGDANLYDVFNNGRRCGQWSANNRLPCRLDTGEQYESWKKIQEHLKTGDSWTENASTSSDASMIEHLSTQSVCARWMPNFEGIISGGKTFFGVSTADGRRPFLSSGGVGSNGNSGSYGMATSVHSPGGYSRGGGGSLYALNGMTVLDGWGQEFLYYSEAPFESYKLWSAGKNGQTFPPWYDRSKLSSADLKTVAAWTEDDISGLNN